MQGGQRGAGDLPPGRAGEGELQPRRASVPARTLSPADRAGCCGALPQVSSFRGRALRLPEDADMEQISAKYADGVLEVQITKKAAAVAAGRRVQIG